ncbi:MAG: response regulator transcription factor [Scytolyngbya sp. HA4215-MV1]|jgi:DNA-binding response OmpR family regulator|nr:response regulator transcription factor [Scytolyngbya sp. HA4215-MV1]
MRLILVEDEPDLGVAIKQALTHQAYIVDWFLDGSQAWSYLEDHWEKYTLAVFDWMLPGLSGVELCRRLRGKKSPLPVLMLTAKDRMVEKIMGLDSGADDYLIKPFEMPELLARLRALQRRAPHFQACQIQIGALSLNYATHAVTHTLPNGEKQSVVLTTKEFQLLEYLMQHPNQILTRDQILDQLWEIGEEPISNVVAAQIRLLRRKLGDNNDSPLIENIYGVGYRLNAP